MDKQKTFSMIRYREIKPDFPEIWRVFISGCSSAGKTYFARKLLESNLFKCSRIYIYQQYCNKWQGPAFGVRSGVRKNITHRNQTEKKIKDDHNSTKIGTSNIFGGNHL